MYEINNVELGITSTQGSLVIAVGAYKSVIVSRPNLRSYEQFYQLWQAALVCAKQEDGDFLNLWCSHEQFRALISNALKCVGIEDPFVFTGPQLVALLMHHEGKQGIIFQFNETVPKFPEQNPQSKMKEFGTTLQLQALLTQLYKLPTQNWMEKQLYRAGLFLVSFSIMRLNNSHQLSLTLNDKKISSIQFSKKKPSTTPLTSPKLENS